jgi:uncharacterized HAD superfamily protein
MKKIICFDIDGVICKTKFNEYKKSKPIKKNIKIINDLFNKGFFIKIYTARYMGRNFDNKKKAEQQIKKLTIQQLKKWKVNYNKIFFGKPSFDLFVDDKSIFFKENWHKILQKKINLLK